MGITLYYLKMERQHKGICWNENNSKSMKKDKVVCQNVCQREIRIHGKTLVIAVIGEDDI